MASAKEQAFKLFDEGKLPKDPEVKALGIKSKTRYNYYQDWKIVRAAGGTPVETSGKPQPRGGGAGGPIAVGKITITPENWGMDQLGAILILDTYNKSKRDIGYTGTIGDFLVDTCEFFRRVMGYSEVEYVRESTGGEGGGSPEADGAEGAGEQKPGLLGVGG